MEEKSGNEGKEAGELVKEVERSAGSKTKPSRSRI